MDPVRVRLDHRADPTEVEAVREAFAAEGIPVEVEGSYEKPRPGEAYGEGDEPEWIVLISVFAITGFLNGFLNAAGADAWKALKRLGERIRDSRKKNPPYQGSIQIREASGRETLIGWAYDIEVSDDAWKTLLELDWDGLPESDWIIVQWFEVDQTWVAFEPSTTGEGANLRWDRASQRWRDERP